MGMLHRVSDFSQVRNRQRCTIRRFSVLLSDLLCLPILPQSETVSGSGVSCCGFGYSQSRESRSCCFCFHRKNIKRRLQGNTRSMRHWGTIPGGQIFRVKAISSSQLITNTQTMGSCHFPQTQ